jgi:hypothetical protein
MRQSEVRIAIKTSLKWALRGINPFHNFFLKLLSVVTALIALYIIAGQAMIEEIEVPIYLSPPAKLATAKSIENRAVVRVLASSTILNSIDKKQIYFDFKKVDFREGEVFINLDNHIKTPPGIQVIKITPPNLHMIFEKKEAKEVPLIVRFQGKTPRGYEFVGYEITPQSAKIEGAKSVLRMINYLETEPISLVNRTETFAIDAPLKIENLNIIISNSDPITINVIILKNPKAYLVKGVPIAVESEPKSYTYTPKKVDVSLDCGEGFKGNPEADDVYVYINLKEIPSYGALFRTPIRAEIKSGSVKENCFIKSLSYKKTGVIVKRPED